MRWLTLCAILAALSACDLSTDDAADAGDASVGACDLKGDCQACQVCASQQACAIPLAACNQSSACVGLDQCLKLCGADPSCQQGCASSNSSGIALYDAVENCLLCQACASDCAGYRTCQ